MARCLKTLIPLALLLALACDKSTDPGSEVLDSFAVAVPEELIAGEPFTISLIAIGDGGTSPLTEFDGTVTLTPSAGVILPEELALSGGTGSGEFTLGGAFGGPVTITASLGQTGGDGTVQRVLLAELPADAGDDASTSIPDFGLRPRDEDFGEEHPELGDAGISHTTIWLSFAAGTSVAEANGLIAEHGALVAGGVRGEGGIPGVLCLRLPTNSHAEMEADLAVLRTDERVELVAQDILVDGTVSSRGNGGDPGGWTWETQPGGANWWLEQVRAPQMWNLKRLLDREEPQVLTGVIDSGFASEHSDLALGVFGEPRTDDHGTHVAGIISAGWDNGIGMDGANPFAQMIVYAPSYATANSGIDQRNSWGEVMSESLIELLTLIPGLRVINMSQGFNWSNIDLYPSDTSAARELADTHGQLLSHVLAILSLVRDLPLICVSAGNDSDEDAGLQEARYNSPMANAALVHGAEGILVIENVRQSGGQFSAVERSGSSCVGGNLSAPGTGILSTVPDDGYDFKTGTSMASPLVTGIAGWLLAVEPTLTTAQLIELLTDNAIPAEGASDCVDGFAAMADIDVLLGEDRVLAMLCDLDDGTEDGNQRQNYPDGDTFTDRDFDANGGEGDGTVDMSDFRAWRDALLLVEGGGDFFLDGGATHEKRDLNRDDDVGTAAEENVYPRADLNGDGMVSRTATVLYPGNVLEDVTDLALLQRVWGDPEVSAGELPDLINSGDLIVDGATLLAQADIAAIDVEVWTHGRVALLESRTLSEEDTRRVITVPVSPDGVLVEATMRNGSGEAISFGSEEFFLLKGEDKYWEIESSPVLVVELTVPENHAGTEPFLVLARAGLREPNETVLWQSGIVVTFTTTTGVVDPFFGVTDADGYVESEGFPQEGDEEMTVFATASLPEAEDVVAEATVNLIQESTGVAIPIRNQSHVTAWAVIDQEDCTGFEVLESPADETGGWSASVDEECSGPLGCVAIANASLNSSTVTLDGNLVSISVDGEGFVQEIQGGNCIARAIRATASLIFRFEVPEERGEVPFTLTGTISGPTGVVTPGSYVGLGMSEGLEGDYSDVRETMSVDETGVIGAGLHYFSAVVHFERAPTIGGSMSGSFDLQLDFGAPVRISAGGN